MSSRQIDPNVDYRRFQQLSAEFTVYWNRLQALYLDAAAGFAFVRAQVYEEQDRSRRSMEGTELDSEECQDSRLFSYEAIFADNFVASGIHRATQGEVKARNAPGGANFVGMGQLCLVAFSDYWNEYLRREVVIAKGKLDENERDTEVVNCALREHASHDMWGDIRLLRNSIVHKLGIATSDVARCRLVKWFRPGDPVALTPQHMRALFLGLLKYRNDLHGEQFPEHYVQVGKHGAG